MNTEDGLPQEGSNTKNLGRDGGVFLWGCVRGNELFQAELFKSFQTSGAKNRMGNPYVDILGFMFSKDIDS